MKKTVFLCIVCFGLLGGNVFALSFGDGGAELQGILDGITTDPADDSSIDVTTDYLDDEIDSYWNLTASGGSIATLVIEVAGYANKNAFGVYDSSDQSNMVELFSGGKGSGDQVALSIKEDGSVYLNIDNDTGVDFASESFGYYLDSPDGVFYSDTSLNNDQTDHMAAYQGKDTDEIDLPGFGPGTWTDNEFLLAWENLEGGGDRDYTDFVVMVESVQPVPEPATICLFGFGLLGFAINRKRKKSS